MGVFCYFSSTFTAPPPFRFLYVRDIADLAILAEACSLMRQFSESILKPRVKSLAFFLVLPIRAPFPPIGHLLSVIVVMSLIEAPGSSSRFSP